MDSITMRSILSGSNKNFFTTSFSYSSFTPQFPFLSSFCLFDYLSSAYLFSAQLWNIPEAQLLSFCLHSYLVINFL